VEITNYSDYIFLTRDSSLDSQQKGNTRTMYVVGFI